MEIDGRIGADCCLLAQPTKELIPRPNSAHNGSQSFIVFLPPTTSSSAKSMGNVYFQISLYGWDPTI